MLNVEIVLLCKGACLINILHTIMRQSSALVVAKSFLNILEFREFISITKTCLYNFDPLKPHFYLVKLGFTGVYIISHISAHKHRLCVLVRTASAHYLCFEQKYEKYQSFFSLKVFTFLS